MLNKPFSIRIEKSHWPMAQRGLATHCLLAKAVRRELLIPSGIGVFIYETRAIIGGMYFVHTGSKLVRDFDNSKLCPDMKYNVTFIPCNLFTKPDEILKKYTKNTVE